MTSRSYLLLCAWLACGVGCGGNTTRPTGLPAPEYQEPQVSPWPPASASPAPPAVEEKAESVPPDAAPAPPEGTGGSGATLPPGTP